MLREDKQKRLEALKLRLARQKTAKLTRHAAKCLERTQAEINALETELEHPHA